MSILLILFNNADVPPLIYRILPWRIGFWML